MRLIQKADGSWEAHFTLLWEVAYLTERGDEWVPLCKVGQQEPVGEIHAATQTVRLYPDVAVVDRQVVVLRARLSEERN